MTRYLDDIEVAPRSAIEAVQARKLLDLLPRVLARSVFLQERWHDAGARVEDVRSVADFQRIAPFFAKDDLRAHRDRTGDPYAGLLCIPPADLTQVASTSGTTGDPTLIPQRWGANGIAPFMARYIHELGGRPGDRVTIMAPANGGPFHNRYDAFGLVPICFDHDPAELPRMLELSRRYRPVLFDVLSVPLIHGLERLAEAGEDVAEAMSSYRAVCFGGEVLGDRHAALLRSWGLNVVQKTRVGDASTAYECLERTGVHAWEDLVLVEHLLPGSDRPAPDGEVGELVVTALEDEVAPLIRYRSDDLVVLTREPCPCGRTHARFRVEGRIGDAVTVGGVTVLPKHLADAVTSVAACRAGLFQIIRSGGVEDRLRLRVGHRADADASTVAVEVAAAVRAAVGLDPVLDLVADDELLKLGPPHKIPRVAAR